ncbi:MAG TPA: hypothetical protein PLS07_00630 [Niabella sp.]|nr:hypothetical protein [Niabella sp.]HQW14286.1 hypothetical protein [Niabella sp.]HQX18434.1 hypothetical protein [Niabella sp.]HQX40074.1 hypothetical protein [Niabella sp.]HRB05961.1 hypothetical protein [Niabella sp.]
MPSLVNFPEVWSSRFIRQLSSTARAPWLDGIAELDVDVSVINAGDLSESNKIYVPTSSFEPDVLINNAVALAEQVYTHAQIELTLDKYQTKSTTLSDDQIVGASFNKIDDAVKSHAIAIAKKKYGKAAHSLAPQTNGATTPVVVTTGTLAGGKRQMKYDDLVALRAAMKLEVDDEVVLVLCSDHWNNLLLDRQNFGNQLIDYNVGKPAPMIAGFELHFYANNPLYSAAGAKLAYGAAGGGTDFQGSFAFVKNNVAKKSGITKAYFTPSAIDTITQTNKMNFRHYFMTLPFTTGRCGAIISAQS